MDFLSLEFSIGCPWELLYVGGLVTVSESLDELKMKLKNWNEGLEVKVLKENLGRTKFMFCRQDAPNIKITSVKFQYVVC